MNKSPFDLFIELITFDQSLHKTEQEIIRLEGEHELFEDQLIELQQKHTKDVDALHDLRKEVDAQELEMKSLDEREKEIKARFSSASNAQEYQALKKETESLQIEQLAVEKELLSLWNRLELAKKSSEAKKQEYTANSSVLEKQMQDKKQAIDALELQLAQNSKGRQDKVQGIPEEWLEKYSRMRNAVSDPVAVIEDQSCKACFHPLSNQELMKLDRKQMLQCKGCYRFLYAQYAPESKEGDGR